MHSFAQAPKEAGFTQPKTSAEKVLIKAVAAIINPEGNKKVPAKRINLAPSEAPLK